MPVANQGSRTICNRSCITALALLLAVTGCASSRRNRDVVRNTLASYQIGRTTFQDFKKDAGLVQTQRPPPKEPPSYLNPNRASWFPQTQTAWISQSPWRIYETAEYSGLSKGTFTQHWKFVVGDQTQAICILTFDGQGRLANISPVEVLQKPSPGQ
jgi:hypothetical protein